MSLISIISILPFITNAQDFSLTNCDTQSKCLDYEIHTINGDQVLCLQYNADGDCPKVPIDKDLCYGCASDDGHTVAPLYERANLCVPIDCSLSEKEQVARFLIHDSPCETHTIKRFLLNDIQGLKDPLDAYCKPSNAWQCTKGKYDKCGDIDLTNCEQSCAWAVRYSDFCPDACDDDVRYTVETDSNEWYLSFWVGGLCCGEVVNVEIKDSLNYPDYVAGVKNDDTGYYTFNTGNMPRQGKITTPVSVRVTNSNGEVIESIDILGQVNCDAQTIFVSDEQFDCVNGPNGSDSHSDSNGDGDSDSSKGQSKGSDSGSDSNGDGNSDSSSRDSKGNKRSSSKKSSSRDSDSHEDRNGDGDSDSSEGPGGSRENSGKSSSGSRSGSGSGSRSGSNSKSKSKSKDRKMCPCDQVNGAMANSDLSAGKQFKTAFTNENGTVNNMSIVSLLIAFVVGIFVGVLFVGAYLWFNNKKKHNENELQLQDVVVKDNSKDINSIDMDGNTVTTPKSPNSRVSNSDDNNNNNNNNVVNTPPNNNDINKDIFLQQNPMYMDSRN